MRERKYKKRLIHEELPEIVCSFVEQYNLCNMEATVFNPIQQHLLMMFAYDSTEVHFGILAS